MSGDYSRVRFDPKKHFSGVLMQQGRVQLDADWNELIALLDRRWRAETMDIIGRCVVPKETPDGFRIQIAAGKLTIGRGRMYVHGLLAENHGKEPLEFDPVLAEQRGTLPISSKNGLSQRQRGRSGAHDGGPHLAYLDVWQREVTFLEDPALRRKMPSASIRRQDRKRYGRSRFSRASGPAEVAVRRFKPGMHSSRLRMRD